MSHCIRLCAIMLALAAANASATCRDLSLGDPYYPFWRNCCDNSSGGSDWIRDDGVLTTFPQLCTYYGVDNCAAAKVSACWQSWGWTNCCTGGPGQNEGKSWWDNITGIHNWYDDTCAMWDDPAIHPCTPRL